jgi:hypothetical protein
MTIYVVTCGEYSDYGICALFSTHERARAYMALSPPNTFNDIEEYGLDPLLEDIIDNRRSYVVRMELNGDNAHAEWIRMGTRSPGVHYQKPWTQYGTNTDMPASLITYVNARSPDHAIKIANERRVAWKLEQDRKSHEQTQ